MLQKQKDTGLAFKCFSPTVMLLTFTIEMMLAVYSLIFRKKSIVTLLGVLILIFLAMFQLAEYGICENFGVSGELWARIGFASITTLPVLGLHMIVGIAGADYKNVLASAYASGFFWIALFLFSDVLYNNVCGGNYMITKMESPFGGYFFAYYYIWLLVGIWIALREFYRTKSKIVRLALTSMVVGYLSFIVPATIIHMFVGSAANGLPSIMCGFAVILAIIIATHTLRTTDKLKR